MKPIKPHFYIREEAILIFSLSAVSTAIRGLGRGSGMEALGGSAHSRDKLTECESLLHSRLNLLLARTFSLTYTHICWRVRAHTHTQIHRDAANITQTFAHILFVNAASSMGFEGE